MKQLTLPQGYKPQLSIRETEVAIKKIKDCFENALSKELNLTRVSAPLFVRSGRGINDNLNGVERPVSFDAMVIKDSNLEIIQSLAKWKRMALQRYGFNVGEGLYTDMNAIRRDEELDNLHSIYVDQWDWEKVITKEARTEKTLFDTVKAIYKVFKETEEYVSSIYPHLQKSLPEEISFISTQELEDMYPDFTPKERECAIAKARGAVFITKIGGKLASGIKHDGRSPDYDDWTLNGDIIFWYPLLNREIELSSMGIRVDEAALLQQLSEAGCEDRKSLEYHSLLLDGKLPYTIGGGIGQSRICMFFLRCAHIGEVQASVWSEEMLEECSISGITLL
jgi:aspartate--ammonia ligase